MVMVKGLSSSLNAKIVGRGGEVVVLAHGYGGDQSLWYRIVPTLAHKHQVLVFDWNFSGVVTNKFSFDANKYSSFDAFADDLISLMDEMGVKSCVFVGHSMSCIIGCIASIKRPQLFKHLILIGASPRYLNSEDYEGGFELLEIDQLITAMESNFHAWASTFAPMAIGGKDQFALDKFESSLKKMKPEVAIAVAKLIFLSDNRHVLDKVSIPCTLICTINDLVVPSSVPLYMQKKMIKIKSRVEIIDVDGHFPHLTAHHQLLDVLGNVIGA